MGSPATWKEFKDEVERLGVKDDTIISYVDCSPYRYGITNDLDFDVEIYTNSEGKTFASIY